MRSQQAKPVVLCISGLDPTGGAGLMADIEAIGANGAHAAPIASMLTVQDTHGVQRVTPVDADLMLEQALAILDDLPVRAIKIGLLGTSKLIISAAAILRSCPDVPVVLDPVQVSGGGQNMVANDYASMLCDHLLPLCDVITPNQSEALQLTNTHDLSQAVDILLKQCRQAVLVTGADMAKDAEVTNTLYMQNGFQQHYQWQRLPATYHGSGCTLASALAAQLAHDVAIPDAVAQAQSYTWQALNAGAQYSDGQAMADRLYALKRNDD